MRRMILGAAAALVPMFSAPAAAQMAMPHDAAPHMTAADLRATLNGLLSEHIFLAADATGAALGGRTAEFQAAAAALDGNTVALGDAIGSIYGSAAETEFLRQWRQHIGNFVLYTQGVAAHDKAKQDKAVNGLLGYVDEFSSFLAGANPNLPKSAVAPLLKAHILGLKAVVDAQAKGDDATAYRLIREAAAHSHMIADPLAAGIAKQFPDKFGM